MSALAMPSPSKPLAPPVFAGKAWQQVLARDPRADGQFVYAVKSTGIYCRPTCPSRRPERKNVAFFPTPAHAESAGFRACLRCEPSRIAPRPDPQAAAIARAAELLSSGARPSLEDLARAAGLGKFALQRGFKRVLGLTPGEFAREARKNRIKKALQQNPFNKFAAKKPQQTITSAIYEAGFGSSSRLYEHVDSTLGMSPTAMKAGGAGETIRYAISKSEHAPDLGRILVATTARGLCAVLFAGSDAEAAADLRERFPQAVLRRDMPPADSARGNSGHDSGPGDSELSHAVHFALSQLTETPTAATMPFHVRATAFQQRVWRALMQIPRGQTRTYAQIAEAIGAPKAVRAVGTACGANLLAVVVPCHRAVAANGKLTGYRWGVERKRQLLEMEKA